MVTLWLLAAQARASAIRITTWSLQPGESTTNGVPESETLTRAAETLRKLDADVILLENVRDRESCQALVDGLKPENYQIAACSSFRDASDGKKIKQQVAILSKTRALLGWSEAWQGAGKVPPLPGGFAFAEIRKDGKNTGFLVAHLGLEETPGANSDRAIAQQSRAAAADQLLKTVGLFRGWNSNRIDTVVLAGDLQSTGNARADGGAAFSGLVKNGFLMALDWLPEQNPLLVDYIFTRGAGPVANVLFSQMENFPVQPVTCDLSLDAPKLAVAKARPVDPPKTAAPVLSPVSSRAKPAPLISSSPTETSVPKINQNNPPAGVATAPEPKPVIIQPAENRLSYWRLAEVFVFGMLVFLVAWKFFFPGKSSTRTALSTGVIPRDANPGVSLAQELSAEERAGVVSSLTLWLKQKFVQRLVTDRKQLMATQQAAALAVLAMDERLSNVERQIKERNQEYEQRIEELLKELAVAQEENRELIRSKIELLKLEIAKNAAKTPGFPARN